MVNDTPRGIAVFDVGATNTKALLFDHALNVVAEESVPSARLQAPPYLAIDPAPILALAERALPAFDAVLPVDEVVPCTHGSAAALLDGDGALALPLMDYNAVPPAAIVEGYAKAAPPFEEVRAPVNPAGLTLARQIWWQAEAWPEAFARVEALVPFAQALAHWLGGRVVSEVTSWGAQTQLWDMRKGVPSSLARRQGWASRMAPTVPAWADIGTLGARFRGGGFRGRGRIRAGIHDSSANFLRYAGSEAGRFALLSTGTWIIGFDAGADPGRLDPARDTACGLTTRGNPVPICRFKGGEEHAIIAGDGPDPEIADIQSIVTRKAMSLPNFTDSGGPLPGPSGVLSEEIHGSERSAMAALYCAQMTTLALEAMSGEVPDRVIVDGPFGQNRAYLQILAALLPGKTVLASTLKEGTATGAALLGLADETRGAMPALPISFTHASPAGIAGLDAYHAAWRKAAMAGV